MRMNDTSEPPKKLRPSAIDSVANALNFLIGPRRRIVSLCSPCLRALGRERSSHINRGSEVIRDTVCGLNPDRQP